MAYYLGIDAGTQSLKAIVIDHETVVGEAAVSFGRDLPAYASPNGFLPHDDPLVSHADPRMWVEALERALGLLADSGVNLARVEGMSGSAQQHGSVYLDEQFRLSRPTAPIWMDRSTDVECRELEQAFGNRIQSETGSPPIERFTGPQIRRFFKEDPQAYGRTAHIHLVSSFLCSVLIGRSAPVDYGDGAGMNLLNLKTLAWDREIAAFTAPDLLRRLPAPVPSGTIAGGLADRFAKYGLRSGTPVVVWSGDNPSSLVGTGATEPSVAVISLGTSDTFFAALSDFRTDPRGCGHVFGNPAGGFMSLICFTNGSLAREQVREACGVSRAFFDRDALTLTPFGNHGRMMLPWFAPESTPTVARPGVICNFDDASSAERIRALLESQALAMRHHTTWLGDAFACLRVTGGASRSEGIRQILADVFQSRVESLAVANSAGLGAALRAANAVGGIPFSRLYPRFCAVVAINEPDPSKREQAGAMLRAYASFEASAQGGQAHEPGSRPGCASHAGHGIEASTGCG
jgi:xylulokinase